MRIFQVLHDSHGQRPEGGQGRARVEEESYPDQYLQSDVYRSTLVT